MSSEYARSWKPERRGGLDPQLKRFGLIGVGLLGLGALAYGGYAMVGRAPRVVPLIEADSRPLRVRPDDRGGMQVAGADEPFMGGPGSGAGAGPAAMAPPPEAPQLGALRAQIQAARQPARPTPAVQPVSPNVPSASVADSTPARAPARVAPAVSTPAVPAPKPAGGVAVQLSSMPTEQLALAEWARLAKRMPDVLGARRPDVQRADRDGQAIWRLRTGGFTDVASATAFCTRVRAKGIGCSVAPS